MDRPSERTEREERLLRRQRMQEERERQMHIASEMERIRMQRANFEAERQYRRMEAHQAESRTQAVPPEEQTLRRSITMTPRPGEIGAHERRSVTFSVHSVEQPHQQPVVGPTYSSSGSLYDQQVQQDMDGLLDVNGDPDGLEYSVFEEEDSVFEKNESEQSYRTVSIAYSGQEYRYDHERQESERSFSVESIADEVLDDGFENDRSFRADADSVNEYDYHLDRSESERRSLNGDNAYEYEENEINYETREVTLDEQAIENVIDNESLTRQAAEQIENLETQERARAASDGEVHRILKERVKVERELEMDEEPYRRSESDAKVRAYWYRQSDITEGREERKQEEPRIYSDSGNNENTRLSEQPAFTLRKDDRESETEQKELYNYVNLGKTGQSRDSLIVQVDTEIQNLDIRLKQMRKTSERLKHDIGMKETDRTKSLERMERLPENKYKREYRSVERPIEMEMNKINQRNEKSIQNSRNQRELFGNQMERLPENTDRKQYLPHDRQTERGMDGESRQEVRSRRELIGNRMENVPENSGKREDKFDERPIESGLREMDQRNRCSRPESRYQGELVGNRLESEPLPQKEVWIGGTLNKRTLEELGSRRCEEKKCEDDYLQSEDREFRREKYVLPSVEREPIEVKGGDSFPIDSQYRQKDRDRETTPMYSRQTLPGLSERQTYELVDRNRDKTAEMKNWQEDRRVIREREKYVFPPVKQERIEVRLNHSKPIHSRGRQQDRYREPTVRYDRQQSPQAYAFDYRDRGRSAETDKWQSRDRRIVREKHVLPPVKRERNEANGRHSLPIHSQEGQGIGERTVKATRLAFPHQDREREKYEFQDRRREDYEIQLEDDRARLSDEKKLRRLQSQKERIRAMKAREEKMKQKEMELERREQRLKIEAEQQSQFEDIDPLEAELLMREKELEEKMNRLRLREEEIVKAETSRNYRPLPETRMQVTKGETTDRKYKLEQPEPNKVESAKKVNADPNTENSAPVTDVLSDQNDSKKVDKGTETEKSQQEKTAFFPKFSTFSGEDQKQRKDSSFEAWKYEVVCSLKDKVHSDQAIGQAIRKSLTGKAKQVLMNSGTTANIDEILKKLERVFGNVASGESMMQEFYTATQNQSENAVAWGLRLEEIMKQAVDKEHVKPESTNKMLKNRFWKGLRSERLKNATRIHFFNTEDYQELLSRVREEENEMKLFAGVQHQPVNTNFKIPTEKKETPDTSKLDLLYEKLTAMEEDMKELKKKSEWKPKPPRPFIQHDRRQQFDRNKKAGKKETEAKDQEETAVKQEDLNC